MTSRRKLIIDCDPGCDDALAILMALSQPDVEIIAVTCVEGNTDVKQTALNALRVLHTVNRGDIPVYAGCDAPLLGDIKPRTSAVDYHGNDAFGDSPDPNAPDASHLQTEHAVQALLRLSKEHSEVSIVAIGPLTNIAMAVRLDPLFGTRLKSCSIMGGNYQGRGNVTAAGEFNFYFDPESAYVVLNQLRCPIILLPWETCLDHPFSWEYYNKTRNLGTVKSNFMKVINRTSMEWSDAREYTIFIPADETLMACYLDDNIITKTERVYASVETTGRYTAGQMVVDWKGVMGKQPNVTLITAIDQQAYETLLYKALAS